MDVITTHFMHNQDQLLYALAGLCLVLELTFLGMSGPLLFVAMGSLLTGLLLSLGIISSWGAILVSLGVLSSLSAALLWRPLKRFQNVPVAQDTSSDMVGRVLPVSAAIGRDAGRVKHSGIEWQARLVTSDSPAIEVGARAQVVAVDGTLLMVKPE
jgi:inner membrane protein